MHFNELLSQYPIHGLDISSMSPITVMNRGES